MTSRSNGTCKTVSEAGGASTKPKLTLLGGLPFAFATFNARQFQLTPGLSIAQL
jgi:hypothetical protein